MRVRLAYLIQAVFAVLVAVGLSFGASRAMASTSGPPVYCEARGYDYIDSYCGSHCVNNIGYCGEDGFCRCGQIP
jgi:hypothetical protein